MKIILSANEDVYTDMLLNDINPKLKMSFVRGVNACPLVDISTDDDGNTVYDISEEYILGVSDILIKNAPVIVPLCKGLIAAVRAMTTNIFNFVKDLLKKHAKRRNDIANAEHNIAMAKHMMEKAESILNKTTEEPSSVAIESTEKSE